MTDALLHISFIVQAFSILFSPDNNRLAIYKKPYCNIKIIISSLQNDPTYFFKGINRHSMFFFAFHLFFFYLWPLFKNRAWPWRHLDFKLNYANFFKRSWRARALLNIGEIQGLLVHICFLSLLLISLTLNESNQISESLSDSQQVSTSLSES